MSEPSRWGPLRVANRERRIAVRAGELTGLDAVEVSSTGDQPVLRLSFLGRTPTGLTESNVRILAPDGAGLLEAISVQRYGDEEAAASHLSVRLAGRISQGVYWVRLVEGHPDGSPSSRPLRGLDPRFAQLPFSFDVNHPVPSEPVPAVAPADSPDGPQGAPNSYLARDYTGLRQLMLDRLAVTLPADAERSPADLTVMLVELFAYLGDDLSYFQDDAATEAYLQTARRRRSVRRHARLVGYRLHEGCHARCWISLDVSKPIQLALDSIGFVAVGERIPGSSVVRTSTELVEPATVFSPLRYAPGSSLTDPGTGTVALLPAHNSIGLWHFGELDATLCRGATSASLIDRDLSDPAADPAARALRLRPGDVLVLEALTDPAGLGPADLRTRHPVRLTEVYRDVDQLYRQNLIRVCWAPADALPFDLPVSISASGSTRVSHACGNVLLAGHGRPVTETVPLDQPKLRATGLSHSVPFPDPELTAVQQADQLRTLYSRWQAELASWQHLAKHGYPLEREQLRLLHRLYSRELSDEIGLTGGDQVEDAWQQAGALGYLLEHAPRLLGRRRRRAEALARRCEAHGPLPVELLDELEADWSAELIAALRADSPACWASAAQAIDALPQRALPMITGSLTSTDPDPDRQPWLARPDLLESVTGAPEFVVELDDDRAGRLRFNPTDALADATGFQVRYWTGNGRAGNVAADSLNAIMTDPAADPGLLEVLSAISAVRNPLPGSGGTDPEQLVDAKRAIPASYLLHQPRALAAADYASYAETLPGIGRAAAETRFDGSRTLIQLCCTATDGSAPSGRLLAGIEHQLHRVRRLGHELRVSGPHYRPLAIAVEVSVAAGVDLARLRQQILLLLSAGWTDQHEPALFNPTRLDFGQTVWASAVIAAVQELPGVIELDLTRFGFLDQPASTVTGSALTLTGLQLARLDNDPDHPEHGYASVTLRPAGAQQGSP